MPDRAHRSAAPVTIAILAAGASTRLGMPKQLARFGTTTLLGRAVASASETSAASISVVVGAKADAVRREVAQRSVRVVPNEEWKTGLSSSVRAAVGALEPSVQGILFMACDQPLVTGALLQDIIDRFLASRTSIVACAYAGTIGIPALFPRAHFPALKSLKGDAGAKSLLLDPSRHVIRVPFPQACFDIDSIGDLRSAQP